MTRVLSINDLKKDKVLPEHRRLPTPGTYNRAIYDRFHQNEGKPIDLDPAIQRDKRAIQILQTYYGCDIRWFGRRQYYLAGEIIDEKYVDYIAANLPKNR